MQIQYTNKGTSVFTSCQTNTIGEDLPSVVNVDGKVILVNMEVFSEEFILATYNKSMQLKRFHKITLEKIGPLTERSNPEEISPDEEIFNKEMYPEDVFLQKKKES